MSNDMRYYETFYGIHTDDWTVDFGTFSNHHKILVKEYISDGANCTETSTASATNKFLYPHHIAKTYFIEGVIEGHITFAASGSTAYLCKYRVTLGKMNLDNTDTELFTTGWVTVDKTLDWDSTHSIGEEAVLPFWIDAWEYEKLDENERLYIKVESTCSDNSSFVTCSTSQCTNLVLYHSNDATWEDLKITIPFIM